MARRARAPKECEGDVTAVHAETCARMIVTGERYVEVTAETLSYHEVRCVSQACARLLYGWSD